MGANVLSQPATALQSWVYGGEAAPHIDFWVSSRRDTPPGAGVPHVWAPVLQAFLLAPWVTTDRRFKSGAELSEAELVEVAHGYHRHHGGQDATLHSVRQWTANDWSADVCWQDLTLRTHTNLFSSDRVREWNYGMGDNDFGTYSFVPTGSCAGSAFPACLVNHDGDRGSVADDMPNSLSAADVDMLIDNAEQDDQETSVSQSTNLAAAQAEGEPQVQAQSDESARVYGVLRQLFAARRHNPKRPPPLIGYPRARWPQNWSHRPPHGLSIQETWRSELNRMHKRAIAIGGTAPTHSCGDDGTASDDYDPDDSRRDSWVSPVTAILQWSDSLSAEAARGA